MSGEIGLAYESKRSGAVVVVAICDGARKVAAIEQICGRADAACARDRLKAGVGLRLVEVRDYVERKKIGIVIRTVDIAVETKIQTVTRFDLARISVYSLIARGKQAAHFHLEILPELELGVSGRHRQQQQPDDA